MGAAEQRIATVSEPDAVQPFGVLTATFSCTSPAAPEIYDNWRPSAAPAIVPFVTNHAYCAPGPASGTDAVAAVLAPTGETAAMVASGAGETSIDLIVDEPFTFTATV